ncbi:MAG TPA: DPP IV N-terminal domain-containing protein [Gemmatimonadales bacterium]|nr:DPP IV N-terminal domain-containing protein [Gemmatimonadales bacterium]
MQMRSLFVTSLALALPVVPLSAQQHAAVTAADYAHAEHFLSYNTIPLVYGLSVRPNWLADGSRFWYRTTTPDGVEFVMVDPARRTRTPAFDHARLAAALSKVADTTYDAHHLPFYGFDLSADGRTMTFDVGRAHYACDLRAYTCEASRRQRNGMARNEVVSPDSTKAAFIRDYNLWVRDLATGKETQLTTDGVKDFGYATNNAGWIQSDYPVLLWSPDSKKIATFQQDERGVGKMYLVHTELGHPTLEAWNYPLAGDSIVTTIQRVIIDVDAPKVIRLKMPPDQHRSTICDHIFCGGRWADVEWSPDGSKLYFVSTSRNHHHEWVRVADAATGAVHEIMEESVKDFYQSGYNHINWSAHPASNDLIWYSERTNWGHIYLYDLTTGTLKHAITSGDWKVLQVLKVDDRNHVIYFTGAGREPGDPYFQYLYSVRFDGSHLTLLTPDSANHSVTLSPSGKYFVDSYSTPTIPPVTVVRDMNGKIRLTVEKADISKLVAAGWKPPIPVTVKARDGKTNLYGLMFVPTTLDSTKKYPIVNHIYPGPQTGSVGSRSFEPSRGDAQALAELGFVVVEIDAMGTPMRSHSFQAEYYGDMGDNGLPDQITAMKQLAARYPFIDVDRAGIYGHSGGGFATADAMFRYPEFFKVGIAEAGNHDNREYEDDWGEMWQGLLVKHPDGSTSYDNQANEAIAKNLEGHLLLAYGTIDNNVPPYNTLLVVDSLIKYNKDFDLITFPNRRHGFGNEPYMIRRRWDYFVRYLMGAEPPHEYQMHPPAEMGRRFRR